MSDQHLKDWWCPECKCWVSPRNVSCIGTHDTRLGGCGGDVEIKDADFEFSEADCEMLLQDAREHGVLPSAAARAQGRRAGMKIYEAFRPSGTELPAPSAGLFTGDPSIIRRWVALRSDHWKDRPDIDMIDVVERQVLHVDKAKLDSWIAAKREAEEAARRLQEIEQEAE